MGWFSDNDDNSDQKQAYDQVVNAPHKAALSHELIAAAASYEAAKAFESHEAKNGKVESHTQAKEIMAALAGGFIDRIVESKGLDFVDKEETKYKAHHQTNQAVDNNWSR